MLQAWLSIGYIVLLAVLVLAFSLWRRGGVRSGHRCTRGGYPSLVWMGIRTSNMDNRRHHRNGSAPQRSRRSRQYDRHRIHLHAQSVRQGARAGQRRFLVVVEAEQRARLQRRQDRAVSQHGNDPHVESVALHALQLVPQRHRHRPRRILAVLVGARHHLLWPLRRPLAKLFLRLLQAEPIECAAA